MKFILLLTLFCGDLLCYCSRKKSGTKKSNKTFLYRDQGSTQCNPRICTKAEYWVVSTQYKIKNITKGQINEANSASRKTTIMNNYSHEKTVNVNIIK